MGFIKGMIFGALVYAAIRQLTKRNGVTGKSELDEAIETIPAYIESAGELARKAKAEVETVIGNPIPIGGAGY